MRQSTDFLWARMQNIRTLDELQFKADIVESEKPLRFQSNYKIVVI